MSWPIVQLGNVCERVSVGHVGTTSEFYSDESGVPFLRTQNVGPNGIVLEDVKYITPEFHESLKKSTLAAGDVVLSRVVSRSVNCGLVPDSLDGANCANIILARPIRDLLDSKYLVHYLRSPEAQGKLLARQVGSAQSVVNTGVLKLWEIPLPPLLEQKRIAAILDKADAIRRKRQQAIQLAEDFLRAVFLDMFGDPVTNSKDWNVREVGDLCDVQGGLQVSNKRAGLPVTAPYLRVANVLRNRLDLAEIKEIELLESEYRRVKLLPDDILIVEGHGNANEIGRCAIWTGEIEGVVHQNHLIRVRVKSKDVDPRFLSDYINSAGGRAQMMRASNTTSGLNTISTGMVRSTGVIVPPKYLQDKYALIVEKTNSNLLRQSLVQVLISESVFSLSQKAFSGQL